MSAASPVADFFARPGAFGWLEQTAGYLSIACWVVVFTPQLWTNYRRRSGESLSLLFLAVWLVGDVFSIIGLWLSKLAAYQLALAASDRGHGVDGLDTGLQRLADALALNHRGCLHLQGAPGGGGDVAAAVDRAPKHAGRISVRH